MEAIRVSYDTVAGSYAEAMSDELRHKPLDRPGFADRLRRTGQRRRPGLGRHCPPPTVPEMAWSASIR